MIELLKAVMVIEVAILRQTTNRVSSRLVASIYN